MSIIRAKAGRTASGGEHGSGRERKNTSGFY
jgi:hypothetical protein